MLPPTGRVLCELSGGLDSTTVFATAHALRPETEALTLISSSGMAGDDEGFAGSAVTRLGVRWHRIDLDLYPTCSSFPTRSAGEPGNEMRVALQGAYRDVLARERIDVVLTGEPGDFVFGYGGLPPFHLADGLAAGHLGAAIATAAKWSRETGAQRPWTHFLLHFGVVPAWRHLRRQSLQTRPTDVIPGWLAPSFVRRLRLADIIRRQRAPRVRLPGSQYLWEGVYRIAAAEASSPFRRDLKADTRHPLFYRPLIEFMLGLGPSHRHSGAGDRMLQRQALADRLPAAVRTRRTKGSDQQLREQAQMYNDAWFCRVVYPTAHHSESTCAYARMRSSRVTSGTAWRRARATIIRSAGSP